MYASEVPAYATLVAVSRQVTSDYLACHRRVRWLGSIERVHRRATRRYPVGNPAELVALVDLFAVFGMLPAGYYDLRSEQSLIPLLDNIFSKYRCK
ncbi:2-oxoadipate dioxygenase/decarboxylase family protein [Mycobacterium lepromatosis]|uniref:2-oxoadipate dioxygenase/decarboxylase family protein n=1 Tax=Mycobacterium lepromatosis TaxID=480418 RepID=UPI00067960CE|nr:DUF1338 family protein [Mycobacterium lepromatosis]